ncbi:MAG: SDR family NAD(P)-dependent oxidoreductase [Maritimibacter sp.]|nr:SDR family NAD(P)-dependent oxidoreductase [Maritimibacter sp.]
MTDRSIFITGAGSGIGAATGRAFAAKGWRVGLADRNRAAVTALADEIGPRAQPFAVDVLDRAQIRDALGTFAGQGALSVLFNSAGLLDMRPFADAPLDRLDAMIDVNVKGVVACTYEALAHLAGPDARIITMSSAAAIYGVPDLAVYSASKFAVRGLTEALNVELEARGIWVCDVMVGYVDTPMLSQAETTAKSVGLAGIHVTPEMVADTVWQATQSRRVHWFVRDEDRGAFEHFDATPVEERRAIIAGATGY